MEDDKIKAMLARNRYKPTAGETEHFVMKVMSALAAETTPSARVIWFAPALAFSFAALVISLVPAYQNIEDDQAELLLAGAGASAPAADDAIGFLMEAP